MKLTDLLSRSIENWLLITNGVGLQLHACAFEKRFDHFTHSLLHLRTDRTLANQNRKPVPILSVLSSQFNMLHYLDQYFLSTLFESRDIPEIVFHLRSRRRPLQTIRRVFRFFNCEGGVHGANYWHFGAHCPAHNTASFLLNTFNAGHEVSKITELSEKLAG